MVHVQCLGDSQFFRCLTPIFHKIFFRIDQHAIHIKYNCFYHRSFSYSHFYIVRVGINHFANQYLLLL